jgi:hypothetical protein
VVEKIFRHSFYVLFEAACSDFRAWILLSNFTFRIFESVRRCWSKKEEKKNKVECNIYPGRAISGMGSRLAYFRTWGHGNDGTA